MATQKSLLWNYLKLRLKYSNKAELMALIQELFHASEDNETIIRTHFRSSLHADNLLEDYRERIIQCFLQNPTSPAATKTLKARHLISDYQKANGHFEGILDLMLTYLETGTQFMKNHGDNDKSLCNDLAIMLSDFANLLTTLNIDLRGFHDRLKNLVALVGSFDPEYSKFFQDQVSILTSLFP